MDSNPLIAAIAAAYASTQEFLFANVAGPILYQFDLMSMAEDVFDGIDWFLFGCIQIILIALVLRTWERWAPAEVQDAFAKTSRADVFYTFFHRLGIFQGFHGDQFLHQSLIDIRLNQSNLQQLHHLQNNEFLINQF